jgi:hypothetical protein
MAKFFLSCVSEHAEEWCDPDPAGEEDSWPGSVLMKAKEPMGPSILARLPMGSEDMARLKTVFRMRVVTTSSSSKGELAMEKVWVMLPDGPNWGSEPDSVRSMYCPALNTKLFGFSN